MTTRSLIDAISEKTHLPINQITQHISLTAARYLLFLNLLYLDRDKRTITFHADDIQIKNAIAAVLHHLGFGKDKS